jgi:hypothetical protein
MEKDLNKGQGIAVALIGKRKRLRRRLAPLYSKRWGGLEVGQISRVSIYNWKERCASSPAQYIHRVYKDVYKIIDIDEKGFTIQCIGKRKRWS